MRQADAVEPRSELRQAMDRYLLSLQAEALSPSTVRTYRSALRRVETFATIQGCARPEDLSADLLRGSLVDTMVECKRGLGTNRRNKGGEAMAQLLVHATRGLSRFCRAEGRTVPDFMNVRPTRVPERIQPRLRFDDFRALLCAIERRRACAWVPRLLVVREDALVRFLCDTGLRAAEVSRLSVEDVDLDSGIVIVQSGKGRKPRALSIFDAGVDGGGTTIAALRAYLQARARLLRGRKRRYRTDALWITSSGRACRLQPKALRQVLATLCEEAGISNRPPHAFRRGWFTESYRSDPRDLPVLRARMGWSRASEELVSIYTRGAEMELAAEPRPLLSRRWAESAQKGGAA